MGGDDYVIDDNGAWNSPVEALDWYRQELAKARSVSATALPAAAPLQWTRTLPTVPGWYWCKGAPEHISEVGWVDPVIVEVDAPLRDDSGNPLHEHMRVHWSDQDSLLVPATAQFAHWEVQWHLMLWAGPIPQPEEPKDGAHG